MQRTANPSGLSLSADDRIFAADRHILAPSHSLAMIRNDGSGSVPALH
jgi:hypothetical protein